MKEIQKAIEELKKSPLFNLSLASKELFHSNFLAWAIEQKGTSFSTNFLLKLAPELHPDLNKPLQVEREANNFDLTIFVTGVDGKHYRIVVENKVKSVATTEQLNKYSKKLEKNPAGIDETLKVLLSLTDYGSKQMAKDEGWRFLGYEDVLDCIDDTSGETLYESQLLDDYKGFIQALINLRQLIKDVFKQNEQALINPFEWPPGEKDESLYAKLKIIRMHDIFEKWRMLQLKKKLEVKVKDLSGFVVETGFSRASGMLNVFPEAKKDQLSYGLCYQGTQLKQVLSKPDGVRLEGGIFKKAKADLDAKKWFLDSKGNPLPECGKEENNYFCRYGDKFAYRYEKLSKFDRLVRAVNFLKEAPAP